MRYRTLGLAAAVLLAAPLMTSCRNPQPPTGTTTTTTPTPGGGGGIPGPEGTQRDCGTINKADPATAAESAVVTCFNTYHGGADVYVKILDGSNVTLFQSTDHKPYVSRYTVTTGGQATLVKKTTCGQFPDANSQFSLDAAGNLRGILGNRCGF